MWDLRPHSLVPFYHCLLHSCPRCLPPVHSCCTPHPTPFHCPYFPYINTVATYSSPSLVEVHDAYDFDIADERPLGEDSQREVATGAMARNTYEESARPTATAVAFAAAAVAAAAGGPLGDVDGGRGGRWGISGGDERRRVLLAYPQVCYRGSSSHPYCYRGPTPSLEYLAALLCGNWRHP